MEYLKLIEENKSSSKRDCRLSIAKNQKASVKTNLLEAIAQVHGGGVVSRADENGVVRVKIVVSKQELKQLLTMMEGGKNTNTSKNIIHQGSSPSMSLSLEQRFHFMQKKNLRRTDQHVKGSCRTWRPALQSIPEEL